MSYDYLWGWELTTNEHVDQMKDRVHAQVQGEHVEAGAGLARTKGPRKHNTRARRHVLCSKTNRLTNAQTRARYAHPGAKHADTTGTCRVSTWAMVLDVLPSLSLVMTAAPPP